MRTRTTRFLPMLTVVFLIGVPSINGSTGQDELNGSWTTEALERQGKTYPTVEPNIIRFTFEQHKVTIRGMVGPSSTHTSQFTVDTTKSPRQIQIANVNGGTLLGAYEFRDGTLALAIVDSRRGAQPDAVKTAPGSQVVIFMLKKEAK